VTLPLVDVFCPPYEKWEVRSPTIEEARASGNFHQQIKVRLKATIANAIDAAIYMGGVGADNGLSGFIDDALDNSVAYDIWRKAMPSKTPDALSRYQKFYPRCDFAKVSAEINALGHVLSEGQYLFHGGLWTGGGRLITDRPLSTSFCPQVALRNAEHSGKAYDAGRIDLLVLRAVCPMTRVFAYKRKGTNLGHENEVLFAEGARLTVVKNVVVNDGYLAWKWGEPDKRISVRLLTVEVS